MLGIVRRCEADKGQNASADDQYFTLKDRPLLSPRPPNPTKDHNHLHLCFVLCSFSIYSWMKRLILRWIWPRILWQDDLHEHKKEPGRWNHVIRSQEANKLKQSQAIHQPTPRGKCMGLDWSATQCNVLLTQWIYHLEHIWFHTLIIIWWSYQQLWTDRLDINVQWA